MPQIYSKQKRFAQKNNSTKQSEIESPTKIIARKFIKNPNFKIKKLKASSPAPMTSRTLVNTSRMMVRGKRSNNEIFLTEEELDQ